MITSLNATLVSGDIVRNILGNIWVGTKRMDRRSLFRYIEQPERRENIIETLYIRPESMQSVLTLSKIAEPMTRSILQESGSSITGIVIYRTKEEVVVVEPPFRVLKDSMLPAEDATMLKDIFDDTRCVGVVLLRLGRYAVGVLRGEVLLATKTDRRYVKNRHRAGGSSQRRFERSRQRLIRELYDKVCVVAFETFQPYESLISNIFFGGEKQTIRGFQKRCKPISSMRSKFHPRILQVDAPNQKALESIHREVSMSTVRTFRAIH